jgi:hypothetical protein
LDRSGCCHPPKTIYPALNQDRNTAGLVRGYQLLERLPRDHLTFAFLPWGAAAAILLEWGRRLNERDGP